MIKTVIYQKIRQLMPSSGLRLGGSALLIIANLALPVFAVDGIAVTCRNPTGNTELRNSANRDGEIWKRVIVNSKVTDSVKLFAGPATRPRLSPDGKRVVFSRGSDSMICVVSVNGGAVTALCQGPRWPAIEWPSSNWIYFIASSSDTKTPNGSRAYRVNPDNGASKELAHVFLTHIGDSISFMDWHIGSDMKKFDFRPSDGTAGVPATGEWYIDSTVSTTESVLVPRQQTGNYFGYGDNNWAADRCGVGMCFNGAYVWSTDLGHASLIIQKFGPTGVDVNPVKTVSVTGPVQPAGSGHAVNDTAWIAYTSSQKGFQNGGTGSEVLLQELVNWVTLERISLGDGDCGDFFVGNVPVSTTPSINLNKSQLTFAATPGGATPISQTVTISNGGAGTLNSASTSVNYSSGTNWLTAAVSGQAGSQVITNSVNTNGLAVGSYSARVLVTVNAAVPDTNSYAVTLSISPANQVLTSIKIFPLAVDTFSAYYDQVFKDSAYDASANLMVPQPTTTWSVTGVSGSSIDASSGVFTAGTTEGVCTITATATSGGVTKSTTKQVRVIRPVTIVSPTSGASYNVGDTAIIRWTLNQPQWVGSAGLTIAFSPDDGLSWPIISGSQSIKAGDAVYYSGNTGTFKWKVPASVVSDQGNQIQTSSPAGQFIIYQSYDAPKIKDYSSLISIGTSLLDRTGWTATASSANLGDNPGNALDNNKSSRWSTGLPMAASQWFIVDMKVNKTVSGLKAISRNSDYMRGYEIYLSTDNASWGSATATGAGSADSISINFTAATARYIKIVQTATFNTKWWSMDELYVTGSNTTAVRRPQSPLRAFSASTTPGTRVFYSITGRQVGINSVRAGGAGLYLSKVQGHGLTSVKTQLFIR